MKPESMSQNPYQPNPSAGYGPSNVTPNGTPGKVMAPAIAMIVCGAIDVIYGLLNFASAFMPNDPIDMPPDFEGNEFATSFFEGMNDPDPTATIIMSVLMIVVAAVMIFGSTMMLKRKMYGFALAAAIIAIIPCGCADCLFLAEVGIGIWATVILSQEDVKRLFN